MKRIILLLFLFAMVACSKDEDSSYPTVTYIVDCGETINSVEIMENTQYEGGVSLIKYLNAEPPFKHTIDDYKPYEMSVLVILPLSVKPTKITFLVDGAEVAVWDEIGDGAPHLSSPTHWYFFKYTL